MELGIIEMQEVQSYERRIEIMEAVKKNDRDNVPEGFTAVYLREEFFHILPDEFMPVVKEIFSNGFEWNMETRRLTGFVPFGWHFHIATELVRAYGEWSIENT
jgi:hypothetical protein